MAHKTNREMNTDTNFLFNRGLRHPEKLSKDALNYIVSEVLFLKALSRDSLVMLFLALLKSNRLTEEQIQTFKKNIASVHPKIMAELIIFYTSEEIVSILRSVPDQRVRWFGVSYLIDSLWSLLTSGEFNEMEKIGRGTKNVRLTDEGYGI